MYNKTSFQKIFIFFAFCGFFCTTSSATDTQSQRLKKVKEVATEYESIMLGKMLKQMNEGQIADPLFKDNEGIKIYKDMMMDEYGKIMAASGGIGLAKQIITDIQHKEEAEGNSYE